MSDEDAPTFEPPRAAIPSRAGGTPLPPVASPLPPVVEAAPRARHQRTKPPTITRSNKGRLPAREIKRITTNRRKNLAKKKRQAKAFQRNVDKQIMKNLPSRRAAASKNPNRPLELKTRMSAVLTAVAAMSKNEAAVFSTVMQHMEDMSRSGRRHVISALGQVYG